MYETNYYPAYKRNTELYHHGVLGMKWGIRRYQDYGEGGYNPKGDYASKHASKIRKNLNERDEIKKAYKFTKLVDKNIKNGRLHPVDDGVDVKDLAIDRKSMKRDYKSRMRKNKQELNKEYTAFKKAQKADKGHELYKRGKTIEGNTKLSAAAHLVPAGAGVVAYLSNEMGNKKIAKLGALTAIGTEAAATMFDIKLASENNKMRAYWHGRGTY